MTLKDILGNPISREEALERIQTSETAYEKFCSFSEKDQEDILGFMQGNKGLPILYDGFYKYVLDPERHPERLEGFLTELFGQNVVIEQVLTKEGNKLAEEGSLVVMDIIVRLSDGSIVDVEMQKYGYLFTGERSSCYISDMIMRQYNRVKEREQKKFRFSHMKPVYLVVLLEKSTKEFKAAAPAFIHRLENTFDSGLELKLLSNLTYISLDTFRKLRENIDSKMDAWLTFLSSDKPDDMLHLIEKYPEFIECYHDIMKFRTKPEELIGMFSEALIQMDKNTVKYMIEEQQKELEEQRKELEESRKELEMNRKELEESRKQLEMEQKELGESRKENQELNARIAELEAALKSAVQKDS
uniref:PD-(D/E)XK nuclease family transposase n=1 Tax=Agathobacter sp. TaxID=2021311 RepID=UPI0040564324